MQFTLGNKTIVAAHIDNGEVESILIVCDKKTKSYSEWKIYFANKNTEKVFFLKSMPWQKRQNFFKDCWYAEEGISTMTPVGVVDYDTFISDRRFLTMREYVLVLDDWSNVAQRNDVQRYLEEVVPSQIIKITKRSNQERR